MSLRAVSCFSDAVFLYQPEGTPTLYMLAAPYNDRDSEKSTAQRRGRHKRDGSGGDCMQVCMLMGGALTGAAPDPCAVTLQMSHTDGQTLDCGVARVRRGTRGNPLPQTPSKQASKQEERKREGGRERGRERGREGVGELPLYHSPDEKKRDRERERESRCSEVIVDSGTTRMSVGDTQHGDTEYFQEPRREPITQKAASRSWCRRRRSRPSKGRLHRIQISASRPQVPRGLLKLCVESTVECLGICQLLRQRPAVR